VRRTVLIISALAAVVIVVIAVVIGVSAYKTTAESIASGTYSPPPVSIGTLSGVVATGDLHPIYPATPTTGHVTITADPSKGTFIVTLSHFHGEKSSLSESRSANLTSTEVDTKGLAHRAGSHLVSATPRTGRAKVFNSPAPVSVDQRRKTRAFTTT
jgi:hypothetical protein